MLGFGTLFFLADLLSSRLCSRLLSKCFVPLRVAALQAGRSWAKACHSSTGMLQALRVDFSTSLYRLLCPPLCRLPVESSAWNSCFGSLLSSMRVTCPDHRSCAWFSMASMPVSSAERRDLLIWHMFLPADTENFAEAAQVEPVQFLRMPPVASPSLAAVQERR